MRFVILAVGKVKERGLREAVDEYLSRVRRYVPVDEIELRDGAHVEKDMMGRLPDAAHLVALEAGGTARSSDDFARFVARRGSEGKGIIAFAIGGADGLPSAIRSRAASKLSLSAMTMPHRLARLVLAEQLYRAMTILRGEPYPR